MCFLQVHFDADQWEISRNGSKKLKNDAIPTIFSHINQPKKHKVPMERSLPAKRACLEKASSANEHSAEIYAELFKLKKENAVLKIKIKPKMKRDLPIES